MPPPEISELRALVSRRNALERIRTQEINKLHVTRTEVRQSVERHIAYLERKIKDSDSEIRQKTDGNTHLKKQRELLNSIPGLGVKTIPLLLSFFSGKRFGSSRQAAAYAGLDIGRQQRPQKAENLENGSFLSPQGSLHASPVMVAITRTEWGKAFKARLAANEQPTMVIIAPALLVLDTDNSRPLA